MKKQSLKHAEVEPFVLEPVSAERGLVQARRDDGSAHLEQLINEALADFDLETPSSSRLKARSLIAPVSLPRSWAKKAG